MFVFSPIFFNIIIGSCNLFARILADIDNKSDYDRVKNKARDEMLNKIGNQILQVLKQSIKENREEEYFYTPIKAFNDLYQYFSITSSDKDKINAVNQLLIQIFDVFGTFLVKFGKRLRVLYETRNE